jgi:hypothetical protein
MDGNEISFTARLSSPFPVNIRCAASIDGDTITGMAKAAMTSICRCLQKRKMLAAARVATSGSGIATTSAPTGTC